MNEQSVGVRELKAQLSEYLRRVKAGETILITERGQPIGRLVPEATSAELSLHDKQQRLIDAGLLEWNGRKLEAYEPVALSQGMVRASDLVVEMRE